MQDEMVSYIYKFNSKGGGNNTLCIIDITGLSRSSLASLATLSLTLLSEYSLDFRICTAFLYLFFLPSNCCFFFDFLFSFFFYFTSTTTFSLISLFHLLLAQGFSLFFISFTLSKFLGGAPTSICHFFHLSICLSVRLSIHLPICPFVCLSICLLHTISQEPSDHNFRYACVK